MYSLCSLIAETTKVEKRERRNDLELSTDIVVQMSSCLPQRAENMRLCQEYNIAKYFLLVSVTKSMDMRNPNKTSTYKKTSSAKMDTPF